MICYDQIRVHPSNPSKSVSKNSSVALRRRRKNIPWLRQLHYTSFRIPSENLCAHCVNNNSLNFHIILAYTQMANLTLYSQKELSMGKLFSLLISISIILLVCKEKVKTKRIHAGGFDMEGIFIDGIVPDGQIKYY